MSDKIHQLKVVSAKEKVERETREDTIKVLRDALKAAKRGEIIETVVIVKYADDFDGGGWRELASSTSRFCEWIGRLEILKSNWVSKYNTLTVDTPIESGDDSEDD